MMISFYLIVCHWFACFWWVNTRQHKTYFLLNSLKVMENTLNISIFSKVISLCMLLASGTWRVGWSNMCMWATRRLRICWKMSYSGNDRSHQTRLNWEGFIDGDFHNDMIWYEHVPPNQVKLSQWCKLAFYLIQASVKWTNKPRWWCWRSWSQNSGRGWTVCTNVLKKQSRSIQQIKVI